MKPFKLLLFAVLFATLLSSCNDSDGDYPREWAYVSVKTLEKNDYYFVLDDGKTMYPGDKSRVPGFRPEDDQRLVIYLNRLTVTEETQGYDYNIALYDIFSVYKGSTKIVTTPEELEQLKDNRASLFERRCTFNRNYLNLGIGFNAYDLSKHTFLLVRNDISEIDIENREEGYLNLELRHDAGGDTDGYSYDDRFVSFNLDEFKQELENMNGIILRIHTRLNGVQYVTFTFPKQ